MELTKDEFTLLDLLRYGRTLEKLLKAWLKLQPRHNSQAVGKVQSLFSKFGSLGWIVPSGAYSDRLPRKGASRVTA